MDSKRVSYMNPICDVFLIFFSKAINQTTKGSKYYSVYEDIDYALTLQGGKPQKLEFSDEFG